MLTLERNKLGLGFADARPEFTRRFLRGCKIGFQGFHATEVLYGGLGFGKLGMGFEQGFLRALFGVGHSRKLGLCFARLPFHRGQRLARLREPILAIPPKLAQAPLFALGRTQLLRRLRQIGRVLFQRRGAERPPGLQGSRAGCAPAVGSPRQ